jgi:hypothetical protein
MNSAIRIRISVIFTAQWRLETRVGGRPAVPGRVRRSGDLVGWTDWLPVTFGESPVENFDPDAASARRRCYRLIAP